MSRRTSDLAARIADLIADLAEHEPTEIERACDIARGMLESESANEAVEMSILDGLRWGWRAGHFVEREGGAMVRIRAKGNSAVTHEYRHAPSDALLARLARLIETTLTERVPS